ncbi:MAG: hypothetical protein KGJ84_12770 [Elusimicrobia bacterium]|nr:hypothetical protein [Elusimicrobiota bacterium]
MKRLLPACAALLLSVPCRAEPQCPPPGSGGVSTNWGVDYRERVQDVFDAAKAAAGDGLDPHLSLININDLPKQGSMRMVDGSPLSALQKGTLGLPNDAVIYTFGIFEIACDEAQLATFMLHEMRHVKRGPDGKNHLDRVHECRQKILTDWLAHTDVTAYYPAAATGDAVKDAAAKKAGDQAAMAAFQKAKGNEVSVTCVKPVENEADAFAFATAPKLPYKVTAGDPNRDKRVEVFRNAEKWLDALGLSQDDPGHGTLADRAAEAKRVAREEKQKAQADESAKRMQSLMPTGE